MIKWYHSWLILKRLKWFTKEKSVYLYLFIEVLCSAQWLSYEISPSAHPQKEKDNVVVCIYTIELYSATRRMKLCH